MTTVAALRIGLVCGYLVREVISRRRRAEYRRRQSRTIRQVLTKERTSLALGAFSASDVVIEAGRGRSGSPPVLMRRNRLFGFAAAAFYQPINTVSKGKDGKAGTGDRTGCGVNTGCRVNMVPSVAVVPSLIIMGKRWRNQNCRCDDYRADLMHWITCDVGPAG